MQRNTHHLPGLVLTDHTFQVPLEHGRDGGTRIELFGREVISEVNEAHREDLPWVVFLQGGPGFGAPRPMDVSGWIGEAVKDMRVLLLDERGTGRSHPITARRISNLGDAEAVAEYLTHFRSDAIVADCEAVRRELSGDRPWAVLGQSYGGFCSVRYLSAAPEGLSDAWIAGGLPSLSAHPDDIYRRTYKICRAKNELFYKRYPEDEERVRRIVDRLEQGDVRLPSGDPLTPRRFQMLGLLLGFSDGFELVHYLLEDALLDESGSVELSARFLKGFGSALQHDTNPIFSVLHEACYTQGFSSRWSAERVRGEYPEFDVRSGERVLFTGEMIYPWMFEEISLLKPFAGAAEILARKEDWPHLYDPSVLEANRVPAAAAVYTNDMYVEREYSLETARSIRGLRPWVTDELEHNGLRSDGPRVFGKLRELTAQGLGSSEQDVRAGG